MLQMLVVHVDAAFAFVRRYGTVVRFIVQVSADQQVHLLDELFVCGDIAALQRFFQGFRLFLWLPPVYVGNSRMICSFTFRKLRSTSLAREFCTMAFFISTPM